MGMTAKNMGERTYAETVARGFYGKNHGGLFGKYDNVRAYWEDELTSQALRPFVRDRLAIADAEKRGLRILDLGCGAGQGLELLMQIRRTDLDLHDEHEYLLTSKRIDAYLGLDISPAMVEQGRANHATLSQVRFEQADLQGGLGGALREKPFDLYFSSYGALSHLDAASLRRCLTEAALHARSGAYVVLDLLGRYSPEWPGYWSAKQEHEKVRPYSMSYLYAEEERASGKVESFPIRFWTGDEVHALCNEISAAERIPVRVAEIFDRSLFVGRHTDTRQHGTCLPPLRSLVNRLYEHNVRTRLQDLLVTWKDVEGAGDLNAFFSMMADCWNQLIDFTNTRFRGERVDLVEMKGWREFPPALQMALVTMDRVIDSVAWIDVGDVRANVIEPQLAYVLRRMQQRLQRGSGCGHGLVAIVKIG